jgi:DNA-binding MarR family transcriptional regulator
MSQDAPAGELTPAQRTVLQHLVRNTPAAHTARDVSHDTGLNVSTTVRCLDVLEQRGYVTAGSPPAGARPDTVEYLPTLSGLGYVRGQP